MDMYSRLEMGQGEEFNLTWFRQEQQMTLELLNLIYCIW
jgi:hypothetical protein